MREVTTGRSWLRARARRGREARRPALVAVGAIGVVLTAAPGTPLAATHARGPDTPLAAAQTRTPHSPRAIAQVAAGSPRGTARGVTAASRRAWGSPAGAESRAPRGRSARTRLVVKDVAHLHLVSADGNTLVEAGRASGTLPGSVRVKLTLRAHSATSSFTIFAKGGAISGNGRGRLKLGKHGWDSFGGSLSVRHGSGRFKGAHGAGGLYGSVYRVTDAMNAQVSGTLYY